MWIGMFFSCFFFNDTATTEIYTRSIVGSVRCVQETAPKPQNPKTLYLGIMKILLLIFAVAFANELYYFKISDKIVDAKCLKQSHENGLVRGYMSIGKVDPNYRSNIEKPVSYTHLRAHETSLHLVCRLLLEKKKKTKLHTFTQQQNQQH
eukprot:TRINITY_DN32884_c0_g1_i1.p2 TRINITY_DN32884_c0_g1~~TRINITY_DN32884_c0_g1_i1.p2  ORF type:complete len:175 (+),score=34.24 TRINITY_DN32884_c0_g1_i1:77-526(+)